MRVPRNLHAESVGPKRKAFREVSRKARCVVHLSLSDRFETIARSVATWSAANCVARAVVWPRSCIDVAISEMETSRVEQCRVGLDERGRGGRTRTGWEGLCAPAGLRDRAQSR
jgi:hypothetical protein